MLEELKVSALHFFDVIAMLKELKVSALHFFSFMRLQLNSSTF